MLNATRLNRFRTVGADLHSIRRVAILIWAILIVVVSVRVAVARKDAGSVFPVYRTAATAWVDGVDLYTLDFSKPCFRYHPLIAAIFVPLDVLPEKAAAILWRILGVVLLFVGLDRWHRQFLSLSPVECGWFFLLTAPLALQSFNNGQVNLHLIGLLLLTMVAADQQRWTVAALLLAVATVFKLYPIAIGLLMMIALPRAFTLRYALMLLGGCILPFLLQSPAYVAGQYRLWFDYLIVDDRHSAAIEQAPRDLFLLVRFWFGSPPEWIYRMVQLGTAGLIAIMCLRLCHPRPTRNKGSPASLRVGFGVSPSSRTLVAILHLGCLWMTLLGPSTESCTYTLLAPTAAVMLVEGYSRRSPLLLGLAAAGYALLLLPVVAAAFPGGTRIQHWGPQPAGAIFLFGAAIVWLCPARAKTAIPQQSPDRACSLVPTE